MEKKIFLIDDEVSLIRVIKACLEKEGYKVFCFSSGEKALSELKDIMPDLIVLDIKMQGINGYEVCEIIKSNEYYSGIPILVITGLDTADARSTSFIAGADDYLAKPFGIKDILSKVEYLIAK